MLIFGIPVLCFTLQLRLPDESEAKDEAAECFDSDSSLRPNPHAIGEHDATGDAITEGAQFGGFVNKPKPF